MCVYSVIHDSLQPHGLYLPGSCVHGTLQPRILEWVAINYSGDLLDLGIEPVSLAFPASARGFFTTSTTWEFPNTVWSHLNVESKTERKKMKLIDTENRWLLPEVRVRRPVKWVKGVKE